jgi:hypothetical protein
MILKSLTMTSTLTLYLNLNESLDDIISTDLYQSLKRLIVEIYNNRAHLASYIVNFYQTVLEGNVWNEKDTFGFLSGLT